MRGRKVIQDDSGLGTDMVPLHFWLRCYGGEKWKTGETHFSTGQETRTVPESLMDGEKVTSLMDTDVLPTEVWQLPLQKHRVSQAQPWDNHLSQFLVLLQDGENSEGASQSSMQSILSSVSTNIPLTLEAEWREAGKH